MAEIDLDAAEADEAITKMAERRSALRDQVPTQLDPNVNVPRTVFDPKVLVHQGAMPEGRRVLLFRYPGFGWICFSMRQQQVDEMIGLLK